MDDRRVEPVKNDKQPIVVAATAAVISEKSTIVKRVRFEVKPQIKQLCTWNFAHWQARRSNWEEQARDRVRFHDRIRRTAPQLDAVFNQEHRAVVQLRNEILAERPTK